ncbi:hypothetical protein BSP14_224 [Bacillus phage BSP14]|nr:hypothetical protein BSP14_224 [Bacillus phage BSP14]AYJ76420.1 hypothetical protein BSP12_234 [Bacillus phage BSP12]
MLTKAQKEQIEDTYRENIEYEEYDFCAGIYTTLCLAGEYDFAAHLEEKYDTTDDDEIVYDASTGGILYGNPFKHEKE